MTEKVHKSKALLPTLYNAQSNPHGFLYAPVDIIIPFHGEHGKVGNLIESIFRTVVSNRYQISLVDDASPNTKFVEEFKKVPGVVSFQHETQKGFGAAVNTALAKTKQPYVLILQSDVVVKGNNWLSKLGETLNDMREKGVKMVAPLTNNPVVDDPRLKSERVVRPDVVLKDGFLPMYCVLCSRGLFKRVGGLKEYPYAGGEAEEFAFRMRRSGYMQAVCGSSWVHHEGRGTLKKYDKETTFNSRVREVMQKVDEKVARECRPPSK